MRLKRLNRDLDKRRNRRSRNWRPSPDFLEDRALMTTGGSPTSGSITPSAITQIYHGNDLPSWDNGAIITIGFVEYQTDPYLVSDLQYFDSTFGLANPTVTIYNPSGVNITSLINTSGTGETNSNVPADAPVNGTANETCLDLEWAHAIAPGANIMILDQGTGSVNLSADMNALGSLGSQVVFNCLGIGGSEWSTESSDDFYFQTTGVTYLTASGDSGTSASTWPAYSPDVLTVGGTDMVMSDSTGVWTYSSENANSSSSTGNSIYEPISALQAQNYSGNDGYRHIPDVSYAEDQIELPNAYGYAVYDTWDASYFGNTWVQVGGTSTCAPQWAGLIALGDEAHIHQGGQSLTGWDETIPLLYQNANFAFNPITTSSGTSTGFKAASGLGTPNFANVVDVLSQQFVQYSSGGNQYLFMPIGSNEMGQYGSNVGWSGWTFGTAINQWDFNGGADSGLYVVTAGGNVWRRVSNTSWSSVISGGGADSIATYNGVQYISYEGNMETYTYSTNTLTPLGITGVGTMVSSTATGGVYYVTSSGTLDYYTTSSTTVLNSSYFINQITYDTLDATIDAYSVTTGDLYNITLSGGSFTTVLVSSGVSAVATTSDGIYYVVPTTVTFDGHQYVLDYVYYQNYGSSPTRISPANSSFGSVWYSGLNFLQLYNSPEEYYGIFVGLMDP
jgi:subtilase family serine protease